MAERRLHPPAENAFLVGGPVEVEIFAFFFDPATDLDHPAGVMVVMMGPW